MNSVHEPAFSVNHEVDALSTEPINLSRPLPAEFQEWPIADLDDMEATYLVVLAGAREARDAPSVAYVEHQLMKLDVERDRQARLIRAEADRRGRRAPGIRHDGPRLAELAVQLKERVDLIGFVEATGVTTISHRTGDRAWAHCPHPLHPDAHPSCIVDRQRFHCFSCGADGDVYDLLNLVRGITSFRDRVRITADYARQAVRT